MIRAVIDKHRIGLRVRALRLERGMTQEEMAERIDRSVDTVSNLERGIGPMSLKTLGRVAEAFGLPVRDLFDTEDAPAVPPPESSARAALQTSLARLARSLSDYDLETAIEVMRVLAKRGHDGADAARRSGPRGK
jgi:transcriptional regulator with XRE-family HTH domain